MPLLTLVIVFGSWLLLLILTVIVHLVTARGGDDA